MFDRREYEDFQRKTVYEIVRETKLREMMEYSLFAGGKRFRPMLLINTFDDLRTCTSDENTEALARRYAVAVECIHTYSLIHDDLPCMDNDDYRRGRPTLHKVYGEAGAVLAGDALLNAAFEIMASSCEDKKSIGAMRYIANCSGANGMVLGQIYDLENEGKKMDVALLDQINLYKTSALIRASIVAGAILASAKKPVIEIAEKIGDRLGMLFQITDDIIDIHSSSEEAGKSVGRDSALQKVTYPMLLGEERVKTVQEALLQELRRMISEVKLYSLDGIVRSLIGRRK